MTDYIAGCRLHLPHYDAKNERHGIDADGEPQSGVYKEEGDSVSSAELEKAGQTKEDIEALRKSGALLTAAEVKDA